MIYASFFGSTVGYAHYDKATQQQLAADSDFGVCKSNAFRRVEQQWYNSLMKAITKASRINAVTQVIQHMKGP